MAISVKGSIAPMTPPAIIVAADPFEVLRCGCPRCLALDARYPGQGFQLALFPYRTQPKPRRQSLFSIAAR